MSDTKPNQSTSGAKTYTGSCHCGAVRYKVEIDLSGGINRCNCSICSKSASSNVIVKPSAFQLISGGDSLVDYRRGESPTHHPFCKVCGIHAFGRGHLEELGGDYIAINANCLDDTDLSGLPVMYWDGRHDNWQAGPRNQPWPVRP